MQTKEKRPGNSPGAPKCEGDKKSLLTESAEQKQADADAEEPQCRRLRNGTHNLLIDRISFTTNQVAIEVIQLRI